MKYKMHVVVSLIHLAFARDVQQIVNRAKEIHRLNRKTIWNTEKGIGERILNLADDMGRSIHQRVDDLQVVLGVNRGFRDNSDFDSSSDEENDMCQNVSSLHKKQRLNDNDYV